MLHFVPSLSMKRLVHLYMSYKTHSWVGCLRAALLCNNLTIQSVQTLCQAQASVAFSMLYQTENLLLYLYLSNVVIYCIVSRLCSIASIHNSKLFKRLQNKITLMQYYTAWKIPQILFTLWTIAFFFLALWRIFAPTVEESRLHIQQ